MGELKANRLLDQIKGLIAEAQTKAVRAVNTQRVILYWNIGKHIVQD